MAAAATFLRENFSFQRIRTNAAEKRRMALSVFVRLFLRPLAGVG
jgi:hypothetical protein